MVRLMLGLCLFIYGLAFFFYNKILFSPKRSRFCLVTTLISAYFLVFCFHGFSSYFSIFLNILIFFVANAFLLLFLYNLSFFSAFLHALLLSGISIIAEAAVGNVIDIFTKNYWKYWNEDHNLIILALSAILYALMIIVMAIIEKKLKTLGKLEIMAIPISLLSAISFLAILINYFDFYMVFSRSALSLLNIGVLILLLLGDIFIHIYMYRTGKELSQQRQQIQVEKDYMDFIEEVKRRDFEQRVLIHDIKKHLVSISQLYSSGNEKDFKEYIEKVISAPLLKPSARYCENDFINSIINRYQMEAEKQGIDFSVKTNSIELTFLDNYDITIILCNIFENAIEAAVKADKPYISATFSTDYDLQLSILAIVNSCDITVKFTNGLPVSSKKESYCHGLGIKSIKRIVDKYDGSLDMYQDDNKDFHTIILLNWGDDK